MQQLLIDIAHVAQLRFKNKPIRIWYAMLGQDSWKAFIICTSTKVKLAESSVKSTREAALLTLKTVIIKQSRSISL